MNYTDLVKNIKAYAENDFPSTAGTGGLTSDEQIATFVRQAEERVFNTVQIPALRKNVTGALTANVPYLSTPSDWLATYSLAVVENDTYDFLLNKDVNFIRESFPNPSTTGKPTHYALFDKDSFLLGPTPNTTYTVELHYFYYPASIVDASTSWLGDNFESVLLYGALLEAATFMKSEEDVMANYSGRYKEALALLKGLSEAKNRQDTYRTPQPRYEVR